MANFINSLKGSRTKWEGLSSLKANSLYYVDNRDKGDNTMDVYFAPSTDKSKAILLSTRVATGTGYNEEEQSLNEFLKGLHNRIIAVEKNSGKMFNIKGKIDTYSSNGVTYYQVTTNDNETNEYTSMPDADSGDAYQVLSDGIYGGNTCSAGDWIICSTGGSGITATWVRLDSSVDLSNVEFSWDPSKHSLSLDGAGISTEVEIPLAQNDDTAGLMTRNQSNIVNDLINNGWISPENKANAEDFGIVKLSDSTDSTLGKNDNTAATPAAVASAYNHAQEAHDAIELIDEDVLANKESITALQEEVKGKASLGDVELDGFLREAGVRDYINEGEHLEGGWVGHADLADDLGGRQETTPEEFIYQPTAGEYQSIKDGMASIKSLKGNSVVWNQCIDAKFESITKNGLTVTNNSDGTITVNGTNTESSSVIVTIKREDLYYTGHKMLLIGSNKMGGWGDFAIFDSRVGGGTSVGVTGYSIYTSTSSLIIELAVWSGISVDNVTFRPLLYDLTQMFGEGNEPMTIEEFNARKPKVSDEYAYNEGEIISFNGDAIKSVGFNQWDEEWEAGTISETTGEPYSNNARIRPKNYITVLENTEYLINTVDIYYLLAYDKNYNFLGTIEKSWVSTTAKNAYKFTTPTNCRYIKMTISDAYGTTYKNDICINLVHTGFRNGEYEPYTEHTLYLPSEAQDMKSAGTAYDEIYFDEAKKKYFKVQRMGEVDLGDLNWIYETNVAYPRFSAIMPSGGTERFNILCSLYKAANSPIANSGVDKTMAYYPLNNTLYMYNFAYNDSASFKAAMKGVKLIYELAEPIITEITDYEGYMDYPVSDFGTEEVLSLGNTAPLKADIQYGFNAVDTIRNNRLDITELKKEVDNRYTKKETDEEFVKKYEHQEIQGTLTTQGLKAGSSEANVGGFEIPFNIAYLKQLQLYENEADGYTDLGKLVKGLVDGDTILGKANMAKMLEEATVQIENVQSLDSFLEQGLFKYAGYRCAIANKNGDTYIPVKASDFGIALSMGDVEDTGYGVQMLISGDNGAMYVRHAKAGSWSNWATMANTQSTVAKAIEANHADRASTAESLLPKNESETCTTITEVKSYLQDWIKQNHERFGAFTFLAAPTLVDCWNNKEEAISGGSIQWTAVNIGVQSSNITSGDYATLLLSSLDNAETYIVTYKNGTWSKILQNVHIDTVIPRAEGLKIAEIDSDELLSNSNINSRTITAVQCDDAMDNPYAVVVTIGTGYQRGFQLLINDNSDTISFRRMDEETGNFTEWKDIATTESTVYGADNLIYGDSKYSTSDIINALTWGDF